MKNCTLVVSSCDAYSDLWNPFFELLKKYWIGIDFPVVLITDGKKFSFNGLDIICPLSPRKKMRTWSECLFETLEFVKTDYLLLLLDDFWITKPVDETLINKCINYLNSDKNASYFCLRHQEDLNIKLRSKFPEFVYRHPKASYRVTTQVSLWRKSYLKKILRAHESAWDFEIFAKYRSRFLYADDLYLIRSSIKEPIHYHPGGVLFRGKYVIPYVDEFKNDALSIDLSRGYYEEKPTNYENTIKPRYSTFKILKSLLPNF